MHFGFGFHGGDRNPAVFGSGGGGSPPATQTVTQVQQIPQYQQDFAQENMNLARALGSQPYPVYNAPTVAGLNDWENLAINQVGENAYSSYVPYTQAASNSLQMGYNMLPAATTDPTNSALYGAAVNAALNPTGNSSYGAQAVMGADPTQNAAYGANAVAGMNPVASTTAAVNSINPYGNAMAGFNAVGNPYGAASGQVAGFNGETEALDPGNAGVIQKYMSPYVQNALAPQLLQAKLQQDQQQAGINAQATGAGAFGDARQGVMNALQNYYGQQTNAGIEAQGYNTAYANALQTALGEQGIRQQMAQNAIGLGNLGVSEQNAATALGNLGLGEQGIQLNLGNLGLNEQGVLQNQQRLGQAEQGVMQNQQTLGLQQIQANQNQQNLAQQEQARQQAEQQIMAQYAQMQAALGQQNQNQALTGANAIYDAGKILQDNQQQQLTAAYQSYLNQVNWPYQQLNVRESAISNNPYTMVNQQTVPASSNGLSALASLAGLTGSLTK